ncbi:MAG: ribonuclease III [Candidatus Moranbacteria bacterium]|jgi:ribonuclease-3|nr:ribonuclease III [Candidatus Moranbacteria bacterium]
MKEKLKKLAEILGIEFKNFDLLQEAITHRSYLNENRKYSLPHNERLEFLGDAVLELSVTRYLFNNYENPEGELTNWRASLVNGEMLSRVADKLKIDAYILMSKGERKDTGKARQYILANTIEAIIGAIYLDQGFGAADKFILKNIVINLPEILKNKSYVDPKSFFQEKAQEIEQITPHYEVIEEWGPDHDKKFKVAVFLKDEQVAIGEGGSKQEAQRNAAEKGLKKKGWK